MPEECEILANYRDDPLPIPCSPWSHSPRSFSTTRLKFEFSNPLKHILHQLGVNQLTIMCLQLHAIMRHAVKLIFNMYGRSLIFLPQHTNWFKLKLIKYVDYNNNYSGTKVPKKEKLL